MDYLIAIMPSLGAGIVLFFILRWITRADRTERATARGIEEDAKQWYENVKSSKGTRDPFGSEQSKDTEVK
ncbi:hypothetical protein ACN08Z_03110 [Rothia sp. P7181]|uniref:hypothetical protein n=1 Tax=unclassified Rothia (in: high G+C Gram-positive bacteria) TaxID=2689056 RepID=UPI003ACFD12C